MALYKTFKSMNGGENKEEENNYQVLNINTTQERLNKKIPKKIFMDVYTDWCGPCKTLGPALEAEVKATNGKFF